MSDSNTAFTTAVPANEYEEYIWMRQLQEPEQISYQLLVWQLHHQTDLTALSDSIQAVLQQHRELNSRFEFTEAGALYKYPSTDWSACFSSHQISAEQLNSVLAQLQQQSWTPETEPPFYARVISAKDNIILALLLHPILDQQYTIEELINEIRQQYRQQTRQQLNLTPMVWTSLQTPAPGKTETDDNPAEGRAAIAALILDEFRATLAEPAMTVEDDFFDFGGHSLLATRVIGNLQNRYGIKLNFNDFFKSPSARALAAFAMETQPATPQSTAEADITAPLTLAQDFLWQAYSAFNFSAIYNLPFAIEFQGTVNEEVLHQAFHDILIRHSGLRSLFKTEQQQVRQYTVPAAALAQYQWFWPGSDSQDASLATEAAYQFDLTRELPLRIRLFNSSEGKTILSFLVHHMVMDEWSLNIIMADLAYAYAARLTQQAPLWQSSVPSMQEFSLLQQQKGIDQQHIAYWRELLQHATRGLTLKLNTEAAVQAEQPEPEVQWLELKLGAQMHQAIATFAKQHQASLFSVIYTAIVTALQQQGELKDIVIGTSASGRTDPHFFDTVGYFTTMVAHRIVFTPAQSFAALLEQTSQLINESMDYADIPINHIQKALGMEHDAGLIFDVYIHIHANNALNGQFNTPQGVIPYRQILPERHESMFGLHFEIMENQLDHQTSLSLIITYQAQRYPTAVVEQLAHTIQQILDQLPDNSVSA